MDIVIAQTDILTVKAELIVLKYADAFHGADRAVARAVDFRSISRVETSAYYRART